jgi:FHS family L-fucose permease-like MFS transporter
MIPNMKTIEKKYLVPFILVTLLFLLWGIANNMTDTLLSAFKKIMAMSDTQTSLIQLAFYGSYFCFALPAAIYIRKYSYKSGVILGLALYAAGAILFLPAAKAASYGFYLIAIYILAGGCSVLETTANPYILAMGSPETATRRLNVAQAFNPLGSITGILLSKYFILKDISLYSVSGTYMTLGIVLLVILTVMLFVRMPEGRDDGSADSLGATFRRLFKNKAYVFGVVAQFFYVGAQIGVWSFTIRLVMKELGIVEAQGATIYLISIICFSAARFLFTWLMKYFRPAKLLLIAAAADIVCTLFVVVLGGTGWPCVIALIAVSFFMSLMFPTIYGLALDGVEDPAKGGYAGDAKIGASGLIMAILGGALITPLQGMVSDAFGINLAYLVPLVCFVVVFAYAMSVRKA